MISESINRREERLDITQEAASEAMPEARAAGASEARRGEIPKGVAVEGAEAVVLDLVSADADAAAAEPVREETLRLVSDDAEVIDISAVRRSGRKLKSGLIAPADEEVVSELAEEHAAEPIKSLEDIDRISRHLISNSRWRDNMLFIVGINFGLRVSDLRSLRFSHLINEDFSFRDRFPILEKKTRNTRKVRKNRYITVNSAVVEAVTLYLENTPGEKLSDYMFRSQSNNSRGQNRPMTKQGIDLMLKGLARELGLGNRMATHTLRKTFAYHQMLMSGNDPRKLLLLQKMFGHSSAAQTLDYIGITAEEIDEAYKNLNLGSRWSNYLVDSKIIEFEAAGA